MIKETALKELLKTNDLAYDGYKLEMHQNGIVTSYKLFHHGYILNSSMQINNKHVGFNTLELFANIVNDGFKSVQLLARTRYSRKARKKRDSFTEWSDKQAVKLLDKIDNLDNETRYEAKVRDRHVSEILPKFSITIEDVIGEELEEFLEELEL